MASRAPPPELRISEVDVLPPAAHAMYRRAWNAEPPDFPFHVLVALRADGQPLSYLHLWLRDGACLLGGACTDGRAIAALPPATAEALHDAGGAMALATRFAIDRYGERCEGFFGYCGDNRSWAVLARCGFAPTRFPHVIAHWHRPISDAHREELLARVVGFGIF